MVPTMLGLLFAGWNLQEVAARNGCGGPRQVAVVVEIIQNYKRWIVVFQLLQWILHRACCRIWKEPNKTYI
jgi:hypothetical protein